MVCWKAGADLAGLPWYAGRQDGYRGLPWYTRRQGGPRGFTIISWKAGADPDGLPWHTGKQGEPRGFTIICWKAGADLEGLPWYARRQGWIQRVYHGMIEGRGGSRGFTMVC